LVTAKLVHDRAALPKRPIDPQFTGTVVAHPIGRKKGCISRLRTKPVQSSSRLPIEPSLTVSSDCEAGPSS
jgi:hypothetical protein